MRPQTNKSQRWVMILLAAILLVATASATAFYLYRQTLLLTVQPQINQITVTSESAQPLAWPSYGQSAVAASNYGILAVNGETEPQPTASTAKLITLLAIINKKPFSNQQGETITFSDADVTLYNNYVAGNGTVTPVTAGLQWTQYQAMLAIQIGSSNNVSDSLAIWAFGSIDNYRTYAQAMVEEIGMKNTTIGSDASGYSPTTTSTAHDMALLMQRILNEPTLRDIISQARATLPGVGTTEGHSHIDQPDFIGGKTGYIPEAGGTYVLAAHPSDDNNAPDIIVAVLGASHHPVAKADAFKLYQSSLSNLTTKTIVSKKQTVGYYQTKWGNEIPIVAQQDINLYLWKGTTPKITASGRSLSPGEGGAVGEIQVSYGGESIKSPLATTDQLTSPPWWWVKD